jgi:hypothetical protein
MAAAANGRFTVKIKTMTGTVIGIENMSMNSPVELLKGRLHTKYSEMVNDAVPFHDMRLYYMTPGTGDFIELVTGYLGEYNGIIDFRDENTVIDMFLQHIETNQYSAASTLADLSEPEYMVDVPDNATLVGEVSSDLIFKTIYIVNQQDDNKQGLRCTVKYISVAENDKIIILDAHPKDEPEIRISHIFQQNSLIFSLLKIF